MTTSSVVKLKKNRVETNFKTRKVNKIFYLLSLLFLLQRYFIKIKDTKINCEQDKNLDLEFENFIRKTDVFRVKVKCIGGTYLPY